MFDQTHNHHHHHDTGPRVINQTVTVTEKRAPTDESVTLLKEMEEKALAKLISVTRLDSNELKATWHVFRSYFDCQFNVIIRFALNGIGHEVRVSLSDVSSAEAVFIAVSTAIANKIAESMTVEIFKEHGRSFK